jgi:protein dispatched 1
MYGLGWEIGVSESLAMVILIGFSVDYVVHLSSDYVHSAHQSRHDKMQQSYREMGISILSGCVTTFGSGVFLFGGKLVTFNKFAIMITSTVTISFLVSMLLFGAIMHAIGPQDGFGDIDCCFKKSKAKKDV